MTPPPRVTALARARGITKKDAVRIGVTAELQRTRPPANRLAQLWAENPLPAPTGLAAGKDFCDALSGSP